MRRRRVVDVPVWHGHGVAIRADIEAHKGNRTMVLLHFDNNLDGKVENFEAGLAPPEYVSVHSMEYNIPKDLVVGHDAGIIRIVITNKRRSDKPLQLRMVLSGQGWGQKDVILRKFPVV